MKLTSRRLLLAAGTILFASALQAQTLPPFYSVQRVGGSTIDEALYLKTDAAGNIYSSGRFSGTVSFGGVPLTASSAANNYVAKQDSSGNFLWATALPRVSTTPSEAFRMYLAVDPAGHAYTTAIFNNTVTIGGNTLTAGSGSDYSVFIAKQASDGSFLWVDQVKGPGATATIAAGPVCSDNAGNVYISGRFGVGAVDFDPGPGTANMTATATNAMFILKLDSAGNYVWARAVNSAGNPANGAIPLAMTADAAGNVYTMGYFSVVDISAAEYVDFDPGPDSVKLKPAGPNNIAYFISKLNAAGDHVWTKAYGNSASTPSPKDIALTLGNDGSLYASGRFDGTADFDPGPGTATLTAVAGDAFLTKLDTAGNYLWTKQITGPDVESIAAIALDSTGNIYTAGYFDQTVDFDPGPGTASRTSTGSAVFVSKWDNQGNYIDAVNTENVGSATSRGCAVAVNSSGTKVYVAGIFSIGTVDFNPGIASNTATTAGSSDMFFLMLAPTAPLPISLSAFNAYAEGSNVRLSWTTASEEGNKGFEIQRSTDGSNWQQIGYVSSLAERGNSSWELTYEFTDGAPATGINYYRLKQENTDGQTSFSQVRPLNFSDHNGINIYPNPAKDMLYVSGMNGGETVTVYNTVGQLLKTVSINNAGTSLLSLRGLLPGIYYVRISISGDKVRAFNLVIGN
ncbi:T9SS type A sorting domain-containing protein [Chitinophagaceae bacterium MMS25-I14]